MAAAPFICGCCTRALLRTRPAIARLPARQLSQTSRSAFPPNSNSNGAPLATNPTLNPETTLHHNHAAKRAEPLDDLLPPSPEPAPEKENEKKRAKGPMTRRLEEATEDALLTGGRAGRRAIEDAGFSEELKTKLLNKLADAQFHNDNAAALTEAGIGSNIPGAAGQGTRHIASAQPWTGEESYEDAALRMLNDARKPLAPGLRGKPRIPTPQPVDLRLRRSTGASAGTRAAGARDKAQAYTGMGMNAPGLSDKEREEMRKEFRERFQPGARAMPNTITGLAMLANERIEDAIARGQFKNIPRGKGVERDTRANNPFIDTTEYIMNNMIKRQDIVPPWIEKQQELLKTANVFRLRLRNDWKRHAARMIASHGGTLQEQVARANEYARAEEVHNPTRRNIEHASIPANATDDVVMAAVVQQPAMPGEPTEPTHPENPTPAQNPEPSSQATVSRPFRDPDWEAAERAYMELAIANLNSITRSYNLMAPALAKKPYFSLKRELNSCFAETAPLLANVIQQRAAAGGSVKAGPAGRARIGILDGLGVGAEAKVFESTAPKYGLKEFWRHGLRQFWRDVWGTKWK